MTRKRTRRMWYLILVGIVALILVIGLTSLQPHGSPLGRLIRGMALMAYLTLFLTILSSAYMRQVVQFFGRPFIKVHHTLSVTGLILITLHPLGAALDAGSLRVFLPRFDSLAAFLTQGGRPAWYLIVVASLAAVLRKIIGRNWRVIHFLNYVAFLLGTVHAIRLGTDFQHTIVKAIAVILALMIVAALVKRRLPRRRR